MKLFHSKTHLDKYNQLQDTPKYFFKEKQMGKEKKNASNNPVLLEPSKCHRTFRCLHGHISFTKKEKTTTVLEVPEWDAYRSIK